MEYNKMVIVDGSYEPSVTIRGNEFKTFPNYPPHPPMPASRHLAQAGRIPTDYQLPEHSGTVGN